MSRRWRGGGELIKILRPASQLCLGMTSSFKFKQISKQNPVIWLRRKGVSRREERRIEIDGTGRKCNIKSWRGVCWYPARRSLPRYTRRHPYQNLTPTSTEIEEIRDRAGDIVLRLSFSGVLSKSWFYATMTSISLEGNEKPIIRMKTRRYQTGYWARYLCFWE